MISQQWIMCPVCGNKISQMTVQEIVDKILELPERTKLQILSPIVRGQKGTHKKTLEGLKKEGFVRVRVNGENYEVTDEIELSKNKKHNIEVIIDRLIIKEGISAKEVLDEMKKVINQEPLAKIDYVSMVDSLTMEDVETVDRDVLVAMAVYIGKTRLIDNFSFEVK